MDLLPIQGSAVPCERIFSSAKETLTSRRTRITSDLMEALQMLKFSVKHSSGLSFTTGTSLEEEMAFLEKREECFSQCPDDLEHLVDILSTTYNSSDDMNDSVL